MKTLRNVNNLYKTKINLLTFNLKWTDMSVVRPGSGYIRLSPPGKINQMDISVNISQSFKTIVY